MLPGTPESIRKVKAAESGEGKIPSLIKPMRPFGKSRPNGAETLVVQGFLDYVEDRNRPHPLVASRTKMLVDCWSAGRPIPHGGTIMLTDTKIKAIRPRPDPFKVSDSGGLHLMVTAAGGKLWKCSYRFRGRQKTLSFGAYPDISLAEARARREAAKAQLRAGEDPSRIVKVEKQAAAAAGANTFRAVSGEWYRRKMVGEHKAAPTLRRAQWLLATLNDEIGDRALAEIEPPDLLDALRKVEARGNHETVSRLRDTASKVFKIRHRVRTLQA